jgi:predicted NBD/HSP70 family sugar kinase
MGVSRCQMSPSRPSSMRLLREQNHLQVVEVMTTLGQASRAEIARRTGLSRTTVSTIVAELLEHGLVIEEATAVPGQIGRPPVLLTLEPRAAFPVGIDFDHDRVMVAVSDLRRTILAERTATWDVDGDARGAMRCAQRLIDEVLDEAEIDAERVLGVGVALAGPVDPATGAVHPSSGILPSWLGLDPRAELETLLGTRVFIDNDANLGTLAEVTAGAATGAPCVAYVSICSGIGAGLAIDGKPYRGHRGLAGELGHVLIDPSGSLCRCGGRGCLETVASGPALIALMKDSRGIEVTIPELVALAREGDASSRRVVADAGRAVGTALASLVAIFGPDTIVVGGELGEAGELLLEPMRLAVERFSSPAATEDLRIVSGALGDRANLVGALALVLRESGDAVAARLAEAMAS